MERSELRRGVATGVSAYLLWGVFPLYFKTIAAVPAPEVLGHRVVGSAVLLLALVAARGGYGRLVAVLTSPRRVALMAASAALVCTNWLVFIGAVTGGQVLECSLGYFINPLVSVLLAWVFLREPLRPHQWAAVALAAAGVLVQGLALGRLPLISLILASTFGLYGLLRKLSPVDSVSSLTVEMLLASPVALGFLVHLHAAGQAVFLSGDLTLSLWLLLAGAVTAGPLLLYGVALRRLRLSTMGLLQYLVPSMHLALAVLAFGEPFTAAHGLSFGFIWAGLALYTSDAVRTARKERTTSGRQPVLEEREPLPSPAVGRLAR